MERNTKIYEILFNNRLSDPLAWNFYQAAWKVKENIGHNYLESIKLMEKEIGLRFNIINEEIGTKFFISTYSTALKKALWFYVIVYKSGDKYCSSNCF